MATLPKKRAHEDFDQNEAQNMVLHNLNSDPLNSKEGRVWWNTVSHKPMCFNGTTDKVLGVEYTDGNGININNDVISIDTTVVATQTDLEGKQDALTFSTGLTNTSGTITVTDYDKLIKNTATDAASLTILGDASSIYGGINIGGGSKAKKDHCVAIGLLSCAGASGTRGQGAISIGSHSIASNDYAIQIGEGTNSTAKTLAIGFGTDSNDNYLEYTLLDGTTGLIPDDRISSSIARASAIPTVNDATLTIQKNGTTVDTFTANASSNKTINITVPTAVTDLSDASNYALKDDVVKVFNPSGSVASASDLPTLSATVLGNIYRVTTTFNTTSDFVEGSGKPIQAGNDIVVVNIGTDANPTYKFNVWGDFIDISGKQDVIDSSHKLSSDLVDDTGHTNKFVTSTEKSTWNGKQDALSASNKLNPSYINTSADNRFVTDTEKSTWNGKQDALGYTPCKKLTANNTSMTASSGGELTMEVANTLATADIGVHVYEISTGLDITSSVNITVTSSTITVKMNGSGTVAADTFRVVAIG